MTLQLLALSFLSVGEGSRGVVWELIGSRGWWEMRLRVRREELRFRPGAGRLTDARVVMWKTSRTLFTHIREEHSTYATAPSSRARRLPWKRVSEKEMCLTLAHITFVLGFLHCILICVKSLFALERHHNNQKLNVHNVYFIKKYIPLAKTFLVSNALESFFTFPMELQGQCSKEIMV